MAVARLLWVHFIVLQDFKRILVYGRGEHEYVDEDMKKSCDELKVMRSNEVRVHPVWLSDSTSKKEYDTP